MNNKAILNSESVQKSISDWVIDNTKVAQVSEDTLEVATTEIDAYGDTIYCFIKMLDNAYQVSDDGRLLFKLDPGASDEELIQTATELVLGSGFDFDELTNEISITIPKSELASSIMKLAQLQVAISYLG
ncbi:DUF1828 domain-containing protein [Lactobacillus sp. ESL0684]|uniref:DUF1828 domain-containing protein n=1 Tax=Lactobacillus sp. ESL0684 TaxID=2983213 RepID=UPI0023F72CED|nr:DUF1828 domain-containing protein [Lactobacillus sp. ESL0684]WEV42878.1 DUF1828 domain-containing protein [Lactobacillus sp. ESL0684]